jgi:hypothetical protein
MAVITQNDCTNMATEVLKPSWITWVSELMRDTTQDDELQIEILTEVASACHVVEGSIFPDKTCE